jgi:hypothetical protein
MIKVCEDCGFVAANSDEICSECGYNVLLEFIVKEALEVLLEENKKLKYALEEIVSLHSHSSFCNYNEDNGWECSYSTAESIARKALSPKS